LARTGVHGTPDEHLAVPDVDAWAERLDVASPLTGGSMRTYLDALRAATATPNGAFGTKLHTAALATVTRALAREPGAPEGSAALLRWAFPDTAVVWSRRHDRVRVAFSLWQARATEAWARPADAPRAPAPDGDPAPPPHDEISELHRLLHVTDVSVRALLDRAGMPVHEVVYEDLVARWDDEVLATRRFLGEHDARGPVPPPTLARQSGDRTDALVERWVAATGGCPACGQAARPTGADVLTSPP
jgi:LPS sulfotransferase NodH